METFCNTPLSSGISFVCSFILMSSPSMSARCPISPKPVTSVQAWTLCLMSFGRCRGTSFSCVMTEIKFFISSSPSMSAFRAVTSTPLPKGLVNIILSPGLAPLVYHISVRGTSPYTTRPNLGSSSSTVCPPATIAPALFVLSILPSEMDESTSRGRQFMGNPTTFKASRGLPSMANTSLREFAAAICPHI